MSYVAVAGIGVSAITSVLGSSSASKQARKQRELMWNIKTAELAQQEKLVSEQTRTQAETQRIQILSDALV